jgi:hypothetical protein
LRGSPARLRIIERSCTLDAPALEHFDPGEATDWITGAALVLVLGVEDMSRTLEPPG